MRKGKKQFIFDLAKTAQILLIAVAIILPGTALAVFDADVEEELGAAISPGYPVPADIWFSGKIS